MQDFFLHYLEWEWGAKSLAHWWPKVQNVRSSDISIEPGYGFAMTSRWNFTDINGILFRTAKCERHSKALVPSWDTLAIMVPETLYKSPDYLRQLFVSQ